MKVIRDCISQELHDALNTEIRSLAGHQVWLSSAVDWCDSIKQGIQGSTLTTPMPDALCEMVEEENLEFLKRPSIQQPYTNNVFEPLPIQNMYI